MTINIHFSEAARNYIKKVIEKDHGVGFRLSVKKTGCSGYAYSPSIIQDVHVTDTLIQTEDELKIYVDTSWLHLLQGLTVDYVEEIKAGLKQKRLVFNNPNESNRCGCGESFHVKSEEIK